MLFSRIWPVAVAITAAFVAASAILAAETPEKDGTKNEGEKLFSAMVEKLAKAKTLKCNVKMLCDFGDQVESKSFTGSLILGEGNRARQEITESNKAPPIRLLMVSDGTHYSMQDDGMSQPTLGNTPKSFNQDILTWMARSGIFLPHWPLPDVEAADAKERFPVSAFKLGNKEKIGEIATQRLDYQLAVKGQDPTFSVTVWLDAATGLPVKRKLFSAVGREKVTVVESYSTLTLDEKMDSKKFDLPN